MIAVPSRHRSVTLLAAMLVAQVLLLAYQIKRDSHVRLLRIWTVDTVTPLERVGTSMISGVHGVWTGYFNLIHVRRENQTLQEQLNVLEMRNAQLEGKASEAERLESLLAFRDAHEDSPMIVARVIAANADSASRALFINRGTKDGIRRDMAVVTPDGVVGKVFETYPGTSEVLLLTDKDSGVGALLLNSRTQGVVRGNGDPDPELRYIANDDSVAVGTQIVTSGQDRIFAKDLPVGTVLDVKAGNPFKLIRIRPAARLDRLEEVLVVLSHPVELAPKVPAVEIAPKPATPVKPGASKKNTPPAAQPEPQDHL
jgi:rod shape-determining protein MreC